MATRELYSFGAFTLDVADRRLSHGDTAVQVSPKAYDVLVVLVRYAGRLVTKDDWLARVWPDAFVEEGILKVHISSLRKALGDLADNPAYIQTIPRSGYRFVASVATEDDRNGGTSREPSRSLKAYEQVGRGLSASFFELPPATTSRICMTRRVRRVLRTRRPRARVPAAPNLAAGIAASAQRRL